MHVVETARQPPRVAVERTPREPRMTGPPVPGDDPVVQSEPERRQTLIVERDRRQPLERVPQVIAEEPDKASEEPRRIGGLCEETSQLSAG